MINKYLPHLLVIPEDDANRQVANGFVLDALLDDRRIQIMEEAGGWQEVLESFKRNQISDMRRFAGRHVVLLVDLDGHLDRTEQIRSQVPGDLQDRVFILSTFSEPEQLRPTLGSFETIGRALAKECRENTSTAWYHSLLQHNLEERERLRDRVREFLFP